MPGRPSAKGRVADVRLPARPGVPANKGEDLEARVARLLFYEGAFTRRRVNLEAHYGEKFTITDLDVFAVTFDRTLVATTRIGECKTTEAKGLPSLADRLMWLAGVKALVGAEGKFLATSKAASDQVRDLARRLNTELLDLRDIARREALVGLTESSGYGSHDPAVRRVAASTFDVAKRDPEIRRVYWFVRSEVWLVQPIAGLKKALGACRLVGSRWSERMPADEQEALLWLASELVVAVCVCLLRLAGTAYRQPEEVFERYLQERLTEGVAEFGAMQEISRQVDRVLLSAVREAGLDPSRAVPYLGTFMPGPPTYAEPLAELVQRLVASSAAASDLARLADWMYALALGAATGQPPVAAENETGRLLRLVATFLEVQGRMPAVLLAPVAVVGVARGATSEPPPTGEPGADVAPSHATGKPPIAPTLFDLPEPDGQEDTRAGT